MFSLYFRVNYFSLYSEISESAIFFYCESAIFFYGRFLLFRGTINCDHTDRKDSWLHSSRFVHVEAFRTILIKTVAAEND